MVSAHGASLTNLIWCSNIIGLIEITHRGYSPNSIPASVSYGFIYYRLFSQDSIDVYEDIILEYCIKYYRRYSIERICLKEFVFHLTSLLFKLIIINLILLFIQFVVFYNLKHIILIITIIKC